MVALVEVEVQPKALSEEKQGPDAWDLEYQEWKRKNGLPNRLTREQYVELFDIHCLPEDCK